MTVSDVLLGALGVTALLFPGWCLARAARVPLPMLAGFVGGAALFTNLVIVLDALGVPLTFARVGWFWLVGCAAAGFGAWKLHRSSRESPAEIPSRWSEHWPLLLPLIPAFAVVVYRATTQPLFGVDTIFRWNYLAEQMFARGTLDFYPAVSALDYEIYSWPDGIAPLVSSLYFWIYAIAGVSQVELTAPLIVTQYGLILTGVFVLARRWFSVRAGAFAVALVAASPLVAWAAAMGQETGLTTLALVGMLLYLPRSRADETIASVVFAALAAALGGLAREYGLVLLPLGFALCVFRRLSWRTSTRFVLIAGLIALPWYLRNWIRTGNPLFNLSLGGLFPVNEVHAWLNASFQTELGWGHLPPEAFRLFTVNGVVGIVALSVGAVMFWRRAPSLIAAALVFGAAWAASVGYTAAGFIYSLRVLSPAIAIAAVLGGGALAKWIPGQRGLAAAALCLGLFALDASIRVLTLPANVYRIPPREWPNVGRALHDYHQRPVYRDLARAAGQERLLVLGPNALLATHGARTVPLWSPDVRFAFDETLPAAEIGRRLRATNIGFVLLTQGEVNARFVQRSPLFRHPGDALQAIWSDGDLVLFRVTGSPP